MPPPLALVLMLVFSAYLFRREFRQEYTPSLALSIPCIYLLILGSRSVTQWVYLGVPISGVDIAEGSPLDRTVYISLIVAGLIVLLKRRVSWSQLIRNNIALTLLILYCGISIVWSDFPFVAFKRWTKSFGDPIVMLIILTDREPIKATQFVLTTCVYVLIPVSVLFVKYYPHLGRTFDEWSGAPMNTGITTNKNLLGFVLMVSGLFLVWRLVARWGGEGRSGKWIDDVGIPVVLLGMVGWLFQMADSKTSLIGFILGTFVYLGLGLRNVRTHVGSYLIIGILAFLIMQVTFDITGVLIQGAGRDATLTGRTELWEVVLHMDPRPILGHGFESFWLGDRLKELHTMYHFKPNQAHNGYIEVYLNLGWVGLCFIGGLLLSGYFSIRERLASDVKMKETESFARFGMAFLITYLIYNYTEGAFKSLHFLFIIFLLCTMKYPLHQQRRAQSSPADLPQATPVIRRVTV